MGVAQMLGKTDNSPLPRTGLRGPGRLLPPRLLGAAFKTLLPWALTRSQTSLWGDLVWSTSRLYGSTLSLCPCGRGSLP